MMSFLIVFFKRIINILFYLVNKLINLLKFIMILLKAFLLSVSKGESLCSGTLFYRLSFLQV